MCFETVTEVHKIVICKMKSRRCAEKSSRQRRLYEPEGEIIGEAPGKKPKKALFVARKGLWCRRSGSNRYGIATTGF